jgi:hypothetical protein
MSDLITINRYNTIRTAITTILGTGDTGYGQDVSSCPALVMPSDNKLFITADNVNKLRGLLVKAKYHQEGSSYNASVLIPAAKKPLTIGENASDVNVSSENLFKTYESILAEITTNRWNMAADGSQSTLSTGTPSIRNTGWNNSIYHSVTAEYSSENHAKYFFNAGGELIITTPMTSPGADPKSQAWAAMLNTIGTITMNRNSTTYGSGSTPIQVSVGYATLTNEYSLIFTKPCAVPYADNKYTLYAYKSEKYVYLKMLLEDNVVNVGDDIVVTGTITSTVKNRCATGNNVALTAPTLTTTNELSGGGVTAGYKVELSPAVLNEGSVLTIKINAYQGLSEIWYKIIGDQSPGLQDADFSDAPLTLVEKHSILSTGETTITRTTAHDTETDACNIYVEIYAFDPNGLNQVNNPVLATSRNSVILLADRSFTLTLVKTAQFDGVCNETDKLIASFTVTGAPLPDIVPATWTVACDDPNITIANHIKVVNSDFTIGGGSEDFTVEVKPTYKITGPITAKVKAMVSGQSTNWVEFIINDTLKPIVSLSTPKSPSGLLADTHTDVTYTIAGGTPGGTFTYKIGIGGQVSEVKTLSSTGTFPITPPGGGNVIPGLLVTGQMDIYFNFIDTSDVILKTVTFGDATQELSITSSVFDIRFGNTLQIDFTLSHCYAATDIDWSLAASPSGTPAGIYKNNTLIQTSSGNVAERLTTDATGNGSIVLSASNTAMLGSEFTITLTLPTKTTVTVTSSSIMVINAFPYTTKLNETIYLPRAAVAATVAVSGGAGGGGGAKYAADATTITANGGDGGASSQIVATCTLYNGSHTLKTIIGKGGPGTYQPYPVGADLKIDTPYWYKTPSYGVNWSSWLNSNAIWKGPWYLGALKNEVTVTINFPVAGDYNFYYAYDNHMAWSFDGVATAIAGAYDKRTKLITGITAGDHVLYISSRNGGSGLDAGNPAGFALEITKVGSSTAMWNAQQLIWGNSPTELEVGGAGGATGGGASYGGSGGDATAVYSTSSFTHNNASVIAGGGGGGGGGAAASAGLRGESTGNTLVTTLFSQNGGPGVMGGSGGGGGGAFGGTVGGTAGSDNGAHAKGGSTGKLYYNLTQMVTGITPHVRLQNNGGIGAKKGTPSGTSGGHGSVTVYIEPMEPRYPVAAIQVGGSEVYWISADPPLKYGASAVVDYTVSTSGTSYTGGLPVTGGNFAYPSGQHLTFTMTANNSFGSGVPISVPVQTAQLPLTANPAAAGSRFGTSVAMSRDGLKLAVGVPYLDNKGAVFVYARVANANEWTYEAKLVSSDGATGDQFGSDVGITDNGDRIVVGAPYANTGNEDNGGKAYVYTSISGWHQETIISQPGGGGNDYLGISVDINFDGTVVMVAAYGDDGSGNTVGFIYTYNRTGITWGAKQQATLTSANSYDKHGWSVKLAKNGLAAVEGAPNDSNTGYYATVAATNAGLANVLTRATTASVFTTIKDLKSPNPIADGLFGSSVAINDNGKMVAVGAPGESAYGIAKAGVVYIYDGDDNWAVQSTLYASDASAGANFGSSVYINDAGTILLVGANHAAAGNRLKSGIVYKFTRTGTTWVESSIITPYDKTPNALFGTSLAMNGAGDLAVIGAPANEDTNVVTNDPYFNKVSFLLLADVGAAGSSTFIDSSLYGNTITASVYSGLAAGAKVSTSVKKFGTGSVDLTNIANPVGRLELGLSDPFTPSAEFTLEMWIYPTNFNQGGCLLFHNYPGTGGTYSFNLWVNAYPAFFIPNLGWVTCKTVGNNASPVALGQWNHIAAVVHNSELMMFVNGKLCTLDYPIHSTQAGALLAAYTTPTSPTATIGANLDWINQYKGYIDEMRVTQGVARYTADFTPPVASFAPVYGVGSSNDPGAAYTFQLGSYVADDPYWDNVMLLVNADGMSTNAMNFIDKSNNSLPLTVNGNTGATKYLVCDTSQKPPTTGSTGSVRFGTGAPGVGITNVLIDIESTAPSEMSKTAWTMEAWIHPLFLYNSGNDHNSIFIWGGELELWLMDDGTVGVTYNGASTVPTTIRWSGQYTGPGGIKVLINQWSHIAAVYDGDEIRIYVNGVKWGAKRTGIYTNVAKNMAIGSHVGANTEVFRGYMNDMRITNGVARYTGPTHPMPTKTFTPTFTFKP